MDTTALEKQVILDRKLEEERQIAAEVQRRQEAIEAEGLRREIAEERERERLLKPMEQQAIFGIALSRVKRMAPQIYPITYITLPEEVVDTLDAVFDLRDEPTGLSKTVSTLVKCFGMGTGEQRRQARNTAKEYLQGRVGPTVLVPILVDMVGDYGLEAAEQLVTGWMVSFLARKEAQEAALKEG